MVAAANNLRMYEIVSSLISICLQPEGQYGDYLEFEGNITRTRAVPAFPGAPVLSPRTGSGYDSPNAVPLANFRDLLLRSCCAYFPRFGAMERNGAVQLSERH